MRRSALAILASAALAAAVAACGGSHRPSGSSNTSTTRTVTTTSAATVTTPPPPPALEIISSLPLRGPEAQQGTAIARGMSLALKQRDGALIGGYRIDYDSLDDAGAREAFSPAREVANARRAATKEDTILYVGDLASGASRLSIPILTAAGIPQIIPGSPAKSLIAQPSGTAPGQRSQTTTPSNFLRLVATNAYQAAAELAALRGSQPACRELALPYSADVDSSDLASELKLQSAAEGFTLVPGGFAAVDPGSRRFRLYTQALTLHHADCAIYSGTTAEGAVAVTKALHTALEPQARIVVSSGACSASWSDPALGGVPAGLDPDLYCTAPGPSLRATPDAKRFAAAFEKTYHAVPEPAAAFGYEAMTLALDAIADVGPHAGSRTAVLDELHFDASEVPDSAIGEFSVSTTTGEVDARSPYSVYRVARGRLVFLRTPAPPSGTA